MIHNLILRLLDPNPCKNFSDIKNASDDNYHPSEIQIVKQLLIFSEKYEVIKKFIRHFSHSNITAEDGGEKSGGLYIQAMSQSMNIALDPFRSRLLKLEMHYVKNKDLPMNYFFMEIKEFQTFFSFLQRFINEIVTQNIRGCAILQLLHKYSYHADSKTMEALKTIRLGVYVVFLRQLSQWLIYGRLDVDIYKEFFIVHCNLGKSQSLHSDTENTVASDMSNTNSELWDFHIKYEQIPSNWTISLAEKVLFVGQTVRMLNGDSKQADKKISIWKSDDDTSTVDVGSLWNGQEHIFFNKIQMLYECDSIDSGDSYDRIINEIKHYVTERLSEIAFNQADLIKHIKLFKDFSLLGRGEVFAAFILNLKDCSLSSTKENIVREVNQAFQRAFSTTYDSKNDWDNISMHLLLNDGTEYDNDSNDDDVEAILKSIRLNFNVKWPLHLFFSPTVLDQYNKLFVFLLQIRYLQSGLHSVWRLHREQKVPGNSLLSQLRNRMLFLVDNLQYYLQVDVIESQFSMLLNAVQNSKDFEFIKRTHNIFQTNVICLSFLLHSGMDNDLDDLRNTRNRTSTQAQSPVLSILKKIFKTISSFCRFNELSKDAEKMSEPQQLKVFESQFSDNIKDLLGLLSNRMAGPASEPLSQLLLRLDFNYWFSSCINKSISNDLKDHEI